MSEFQRYHAVAGSAFPEHNKTTLFVEQTGIPFLETVGFRLDNPWSSFFRSVLAQLRDDAHFSGKEVRELGTGDARNFFYVGNEIRAAAGIDAHPPALHLAMENITHLAFSVQLYLGDAVAFVKQPGEAWGGIVMACLPQTPIHDSSENKLVGTFNPENPHIAAYAKWKESGLQLVAAALGELSKRAKQDLQVLVLLSGRVPTSERVSMLRETGWIIRRVFRTDEATIVQQSESVSVAYTRHYANGNEQLFWEKTEASLLLPIDPIEAEKRRLLSHLSSSQAPPNVYYHLYTYMVEPDMGD
jgi:hypothetical protein